MKKRIVNVLIENKVSLIWFGETLNPACTVQAAHWMMSKWQHS
jgi:hypothetical protein